MMMMMTTIVTVITVWNSYPCYSMKGSLPKSSMGYLDQTERIRCCAEVVQYRFRWEINSCMDDTILSWISRKIAFDHSRALSSIPSSRYLNCIHAVESFQIEEALPVCQCSSNEGPDRFGVVHRRAMLVLSCLIPPRHGYQIPLTILHIKWQTYVPV